MGSQQIVAVFSNHHFYYSIALKNLDQAIATQRQLEIDEQWYSRWQENEMDRNGRLDPEFGNLESARRIDLLKTRCQHSMEAIVFSALTAEAFINYYATRKTSSNYFSNYLDSLNPMQKWLIIPGLLNSGASFDPGKQPLQGLNELMKTRNRLVHARPQPAITLSEQGFDTDLLVEHYYDPSIDTATKCVETVSCLVSSLHHIDKSVDTRWLDGDFVSRLFYATPNKI